MEVFLETVARDTPRSLAREYNVRDALTPRRENIEIVSVKLPQRKERIDGGERGEEWRRKDGGTSRAIGVWLIDVDVWWRLPMLFGSCLACAERQTLERSPRDSNPVTTLV